MRFSGTVTPKLTVCSSDLLVPTASRQSQSENALRDAGTLAGPKPKPVCKGCFAENAESPCNVVLTGACTNSAIAAASDLNALRDAGTLAGPKPKPVCKGCFAENAESPCNVVLTGACTNSAIAAASVAPLRAPQPTNMPGRFAASSRSAARAIWACGGMGGAAGGTHAGIASTSPVNKRMLTGISTNTGPGSPEVAMRYASDKAGTTPLTGAST